MPKKLERTSRGLRDLLFDEIEQLRDGNGDPQRAMAVANLAKQIMGTVKIEMDYHRICHADQPDAGPAKLGVLELGTVADAAGNATER